MGVGGGRIGVRGGCRREQKSWTLEHRRGLNARQSPFVFPPRRAETIIYPSCEASTDWESCQTIKRCVMQCNNHERDIKDNLFFFF